MLNVSDPTERQFYTSNNSIAYLAVLPSSHNLA